MYTFRREADRYTVVPTSTFSGLMVGMFAAGGLLMLYLSSIFFLHANSVRADVAIGAIFLLVAGYSASLAASAWRTRATPLSIESNGRVSYGERELCPPGSVRSVRIAASRREVNDCEVALEVAGGELVYVPSQYFATFGNREQARQFAAKVAQVMEVPVTES